MREKGRAAIYALAGVYLLYLSYYMFQNRADSVGLEETLVWIFMILFLILGVGMIVLGGVVISKIRKKEIEEAKKQEGK